MWNRVLAVLVLWGCSGGEKGEPGEMGVPGRNGPEGPQGEMGSTGEQGPVGPQGPAGANAPRLGLRDANSADAHVIVAPIFPVGPFGPFGPPPAQQITDLGPNAVKCVPLQFVDNNYLAGIFYDLMTGLPDPCYANITSAHDFPFFFYFTTPNCTGNLYSPWATLGPVRVANTLLYAPGATPTLTNVTSYQWDGTECAQVEQLDLWQYVQLPSFAYTALPNPPYTLVQEY